MKESILKEKINLLFNYRKFPELFQAANQKYDRHALKRKLVDLQVAIYRLDHYLESNWKIKKSELAKKWQSIYVALKDCGVAKKHHHEYCKLIYKYQKHELYLRDQKLPLRFNKEYYYYFKSCDVKLLRRIIFDHYPALQNEFPASDWRYFDLITEVNDDVEDVFEDCETINGNYFLIQWLNESPTEAKKQFAAFIKEIKLKDKNRLLQKGEKYAWCSKLTQKECTQTLKLLNSNYSKAKKENLKAILQEYI